MSLKLTRLSQNATIDSNFRIIAAIEHESLINGQPSHVVVGYNELRNEYATWQQGWYPINVSEKRTNWFMMFELGNYFQTSLSQPNARELAYRDMMERAGITPDPDKFVTRENFIAVVTQRDDFGRELDERDGFGRGVDNTPPSPEPLADWEINLMWPIISRIKSMSNRQGIYNLLSQNKKIQAIKLYRDQLRTYDTIPPLKEAKDEIDRLAAIFFPNLYDPSGHCRY